MNFKKLTLKEKTIFRLTFFKKNLVYIDGCYRSNTIVMSQKSPSESIHIHVYVLIDKRLFRVSITMAQMAHFFISVTIHNSELMASYFYLTS